MYRLEVERQNEKLREENETLRGIIEQQKKNLERVERMVIASREYPDFTRIIRRPTLVESLGLQY